VSLHSLSLEDRVYLERARLFFGNAARNLLSALIGGGFIVLILNSAGAPLWQMLLWFSLLSASAVVTGLIENQYKNVDKSVESVRRWVFARSSAGAVLAIIYGVTPFVFRGYLDVQEEMFLFIVLSAMTSISAVGYSTMPRYYTTLSFLSLTPLTLYFLLHLDRIHLILAMTAFIWQFLILSKAWLVSKSAINAIRLNEKLHKEIVEHKATKKKLEKLASHDILTGVPNRLLLMKNLDSMISLAERNKQKVVVMFLDLDGFKEINDTHGHESGDYVLIEVASRLQGLMRKSDTLARMGGDEFILAFTQSDDVDALANRVIETLSKPILLPNELSVNVGASIGVSLFDDDSLDSEELIRIADDRMYISKSLGKNSYTFN